MNKPQQAIEEAMEFARTTGREYGIPEHIAQRIMEGALIANGCLPRSGSSPLDLNDDELLHPGWDEPTSNVVRSLATTGIAVHVSIGEDGSVKIVKRGRRLVETNLDELNNPPLVETVRNYVATATLLNDMVEEKNRLAVEIKSLNRFLEYEPTLIKYAITQGCFPEGTVKHDLEIIYARDGLDGDYFLQVNGVPSDIHVPEELGQTITARAKALERSRADIIAKNQQFEELGLKIASSRAVLPRLEQKIQHLSNSLNPVELNRRLNGDFIGLTLDGWNQPAILVKRTVNEESDQATPDLKQWLIARHLAGHELSETVQESLGIKKAIQAVARAIKAPNTAAKPKPAKR